MVVRGLWDPNRTLNWWLCHVNSISLSAAISQIRKWTLIVNYSTVSGVSPFLSQVQFLFPLLLPLCWKYIKGSCLSLVVYSQPLLLRPLGFAPPPLLSQYLSSRLVIRPPLCYPSMPDYPPVRRNIPSPPGPAGGKVSKKPGAPKAKGAVRAKSGCYTCRIRRKVGSSRSSLPAHNRSRFICRNVTSSRTHKAVARRAFVFAFNASDLAPSVQNG